MLAPAFYLCARVRLHLSAPYRARAIDQWLQPSHGLYLLTGTHRSFSHTTISPPTRRLQHTMSQSITISVASTGRKITVPTGLFINNEFVPSVDSKETIEYVHMHRIMRDLRSSRSRMLT